MSRRVVVIGGSGHIGTYLIPLLIARSYHVINVSRGTAKPYTPHPAWDRVEHLSIDRTAEEEAGTFGNRIASLNADIVIDLIAFKLPSVQQLYEALRGKIEQYIFCSTIWVYGHSVTVPTTEAEHCDPPDEYGKGKVECERFLMEKARKDGYPATSFRPGHIVGPGWVPINPQGNFNPSIYDDIAAGRPLTIPDLGLNTLHHVHAFDLATWVICAIDNRAATTGECFNTVSSQAITLRGYAEAMYTYFRKEPKLEYAPLREWQTLVSEQDFGATLTHISRSPCSSIEKSRRIGWTPRYISLEAVQEAVEALIKDGKVKR